MATERAACSPGNRARPSALRGLERSAAVPAGHGKMDAPGTRSSRGKRRWHGCTLKLLSAVEQRGWATSSLTQLKKLMSKRGEARTTGVIFMRRAYPVQQAAVAGQRSLLARLHRQPDPGAARLSALPAWPSPSPCARSHAGCAAPARDWRTPLGQCNATAHQAFLLALVRV